MTSLAPVPSDSSTCAHCSAPLVADQRYCLSCGQPASPVRLAFLDVLQSDRQPQLGAGAVGTTPVTYTPYIEAAAGPAWLRRYTPLFGVAAVLLLAMTIGLLVGHWVTQKNAATGPQIIKVEGLGGSLASATGTTAATGATSSTTASGSAKSEEAKEKAEAKAEEAAEAKGAVKSKPAKKLNPTAVKKLEQSTGKTHEAELNKLTTAPIEVK